MIGQNKLGKVPVEILIKDVVDELDDIEQASTVLMASKQFRDTVTSAGLTGIEFYPPLGYVLRGKNKLFERMLRQCREEKNFEIIHVSGKGGSVADASGLELLKSCEACGWIEWSLPKNGFHVNKTQWDGSDFFHVKEFGPFFMTERAKDVLSSAGISNFGAQPIDEYRSPFP
jgi:hypothetical protein